MSYDEHLISMAGGDGDVLDQIQRRADAATEGPWEAGGMDSGHSRFEMQVWITAGKSGDSICDMDGLSRSRNDEVALDDGYKDAQFIAHARTDIPALLALVREQQARLDRGKAIHSPCQMFEYDDVNNVFVLDGDGDKKVMATICRGCTPDEVIEDAEDWSYDDSRAVNWPCETIAALEPTP